MKGTFVRYDESTGTVFIKADARPEASSLYAIADAAFPEDKREIRAMVLGGDGRRPPKPKDENYYLIVPEEHRRQMSIKPGMAVDFDLVEKGSKEVARIRF